MCREDANALERCEVAVFTNKDRLHVHKFPALAPDLIQRDRERNRTVLLDVLYPRARLLHLVLMLLRVSLNDIREVFTSLCHCTTLRSSRYCIRLARSRSPSIC